VRTDLARVEQVAAGDNHLAVVATTRADGTVQSSVVNAGIVAHPVHHQDTLAFVTYGPAKLAHLRRRPSVTLTFRAGWDWVAVEGRAELLGPDDPGLDADALRLLLRDVFTAAGGTHDDWGEYDRVMAEQRRTAVLVSPDRIYTN
jgi:PPOX class probable F420-dependent enzyme